MTYRNQIQCRPWKDNFLSTVQRFNFNSMLSKCPFHSSLHSMYSKCLAGICKLEKVVWSVLVWEHILFGGQWCRLGNFLWSNINLFSVVSGFFSLCFYPFPFLLSPGFPHTLNLCLLLSHRSSFGLPFFLFCSAVTVQFTM